MDTTFNPAYMIMIYNNETGKFDRIEKVTDELCKVYEYEIYFSLIRQNNQHPRNCQHHILCKDFNELTIALEKLKLMVKIESLNMQIWLH